MVQDIRKQQILGRLKNSPEIYVIFSKYTNMPYVVCDEETFNDEIFVFDSQTTAQEKADSLTENQEAVAVQKIENRSFLGFYSSLYLMGVNALVVILEEGGMEIELSELVKQPDYSKLKDGTVRVDNPSLHLTALYYMQQLRKHPGEKPTPELKAMEEEMLVNLQRGTFIVPVQEDKKVPFITYKDGKKYQPVFTDVMEFNKFNKEKKFRGAVVPYVNFKNIVLKEVDGVVMNPLGFHLILLKQQIQ